MMAGQKGICSDQTKERKKKEKKRKKGNVSFLKKFSCKKGFICKFLTFAQFEGIF